MALTLPAHLQSSFSLLEVEWPREDEDYIRMCGTAFRACATTLTGEVNPTVHGVGAHAATENSGDHIDDLNNYLADYHDDEKQTGHLQSLAASLHALADGHDLFARVIEIVKAILKLLATYAFIAMVWALATAVISGGIAALKARSFIAILRVFAKKVVATLRHKLERYFGQKLIRAVETRLRRMLGAKAPKFPVAAKGSRFRRAFGPTTALAAAGGTRVLIEEEGPDQHSPPLPDRPKGDEKTGIYRLGRIEAPNIGYDHDFPYDPDEKPTWDDYKSWYKWRATLRGGQFKRDDLKDGLAAYEHYMEGSGADFKVDYERAYEEDEGVRYSVDDEVMRAQEEAQRLYDESGHREFQMTGAPSRGDSDTENWQKTIGDHTIWGGADVKVEGDQATMTITIHAEDRYNFNRDATDAKTGKPDNENGRFETLGWARSFDTHGALTRTVTWTLPPK